MRWSAAYQEGPRFANLIDPLAADLRHALGGRKADLAIVTVADVLRREVLECWARLVRELPARTIIGCTAPGVIGAGRYSWKKPAVSVLAGHLPDVRLTPLMISKNDLPGPDATPAGWRRQLGVSDGVPPSSLVLLAAGEQEALESTLAGLDLALPSCEKVGAVISAAGRTGDRLLMCGSRVLSEGTVGIGFSRGIECRAAAGSQARPIGRPVRVTSAQDNVIISIDERTPMEYLIGLYDSLSDRDQDLLRTSLRVGVSADPLDDDPGPGDFLLRDIVGFDRSVGIMAIDQTLHAGRMVQFHLRDPHAPDTDSTIFLPIDGTPPSRRSSRAGLLFWHAGREECEELLFDDGFWFSRLKGMPTAGLFTHGEIISSHGGTQRHVCTQTFALLMPNARRSPISVTSRHTDGNAD